MLVKVSRFVSQNPVWRIIPVSIYLLLKENRLTGQFAPYPKKTVQGGHNQLQMLVKEREAYIAKVDNPEVFHGE